MNQVAEATRKQRGPVIVIATPGAGSLVVVPDNLVSIDMAAALEGSTRAAIEGRIYRGDWIEGRQYHRDPKGAIWINRKGVQAWKLSGKA